MSEDGPKSAVELAMEKLNSRGDLPIVKLSDEQKNAIAEIRNRCTAQIAELEIKQEAKMKIAASYEELEMLRAELSRDKKRLKEKAEDGVRKVREQS